MEQTTVEISQSGAGLALDAWTMARSYPQHQINTQKFTQSFEEYQSIAQSRNDQADWEAMGPKNIAGRALALAFHPTDSTVIFLGSASGGLWKTTSAGLGTNAWEKVNIGYPVLGVSSIAISSTNSQVMYIGTGEVYNSQETMPGIVNRLTRGTYGFGIFKSIDGGKTWEKSLDWSYEEMRGIQKIAINPLNDQVIYAASTIGLLKSTDTGENWGLIHDVPMAVDIVINSMDTNLVLVSHGTLFHEETGIYRSTDGGRNFMELSVGLPTHYSGKAMLAMYPNTSTSILVAVADAFQSIGLYRSFNSGDSWTQIHDIDIAAHQGWYSHDVAVNPNNTSEIVQVGIDAWKSNNSGFTMEQQTFWFNSRKGQVPVGKPDGPPNYVHSDIHQAIFHPLMENTVFLATDGGVFVSKDGGSNYESRNGGLQTTQFYANFANSSSNPDFSIGGMQDNSTAIYKGEDAWIRVLGGDGMSAAIDPSDDQYVYGSAQFLNIFRSSDGGVNFEDVAPGAIEPIFTAPFEIAPSNPSIIYAGARLLYKSIDRGTTWATPNGSFIDEGNAILKIAVASNNADRLLLSTAPTETEEANVFMSGDGGRNWTKINGLPNRLAVDMIFHPEDEAIAFIIFGGFNTFHVYQTLNGGVNWFPIDNNLPDIPHNSIAIDPNEPDHIYIGNDLGIYMSEDGGGTWLPFMNGLPEAVLAMDLSISLANEKLRLASHGSGVFQTDLVSKVVSSINPKIQFDLVELAQNYPNPVMDQTVISFSLKQRSEVIITIYDIQGKIVERITTDNFSKGKHQITYHTHHLFTGNYIYELKGKTKGGRFFKRSKRLVKY